MKNLSILISNDDGIDAPGIKALANFLREIADVTIVAPDKQQSAVGHAITVNTPLRVRKVERDGNFFGYAVDGTPADAVKLAVRSIMNKPPNLIVSGINHGSNTAISVLYSGTVSAATEGTILGIPSFAISLTTFSEADFSFAASFAQRLALMIIDRGLPKGTLLNVNVPAVPVQEIRGVVITKQGKSIWNDEFERRHDPSNKEYFWLKGDLLELDFDDDVDQRAILNNKVSITPLHYDLTDYTTFEKMKTWDLNSLLSYNTQE
ncbi:MAG: 5'/3'-nucleotidase SurE [Bacteroidota bacterium]|nr:5'/3'-nucleotidase SurE [Bacteroidota bacterium]